MRSETCKLVFISGPDYDNHLPTEDYLARVSLAAPIRKLRFQTCNKYLSENVYENYLGSPAHIINFKRVEIKWRICQISKVELRFSIWDRHRNPKKHIIIQDHLHVQEQNIVPSH